MAYHLIGRYTEEAITSLPPPVIILESFSRSYLLCCPFLRTSVFFSWHNIYYNKSHTIVAFSLPSYIGLRVYLVTDSWSNSHLLNNQDGEQLKVKFYPKTFQKVNLQLPLPLPLHIRPLLQLWRCERRLGVQGGGGGGYGGNWRCPGGGRSPLMTGRDTADSRRQPPTPSLTITPRLFSFQVNRKTPRCPAFPATAQPPD